MSSFFILIFSRWRVLAVQEVLRLLGERACRRRRRNRRTPSSSLQVFRFPAKTVLDLDFPEPDYHKPERPSELDFSSGQNKRQGFVFNHNWNLNKF